MGQLLTKPLANLHTDQPHSHHLDRRHSDATCLARLCWRWR
jgi:hypothetical protein